MRILIVNPVQPSHERRIAAVHNCYRVGNVRNLFLVLIAVSFLVACGGGGGAYTIVEDVLGRDRRCGLSGRL